MTEHLISFEDAHNDLLDCAAYLAEEIADAETRGEAFEKIVPYYLERGAVDLAAELANTIDFAPRREMLLLNVAVKCAEIDDDEYAFQLIEAIDDDVLSEAAKERVIIEIAAKGDTEKVLPLARTLKNNASVLGFIAVKMNENGDEIGALNLVEEIDDPAEKSDKLQLIALEKYAADEKDKAFELLEKAYQTVSAIDYAPDKIKALHSVSYSFGEVQRRDRSIEILAEIQRVAESLGTVDRDNRLSEVSLAFFEAGSVDLADRALDFVQDKTQIASVLVGYAREYWDKDEKVEAREALREAYQVLLSQGERETRDSLTRFKTFTAITAQFAEFGEAETAIDAADRIQFDGERHAALAQIARTLAAQNEEQSAHRALKLITDAEIRTFALLKIADDYYRAENLPQAVEYTDEAAKSLDDAETNPLRLRLSVAAANRYAVFGANDKAHQTAEKILREVIKLRNPSLQSNVLADLSAGFKQANLELNQTEKELLQTILD